MNLRVIESREEFQALRDDWNTLVGRIVATEAFFSWEWAAAHIEHGLAADDELFIIVAESGTELQGIVPLCLQRAGIGPLSGKVLRTLTGDHADYGSFYFHPACNHRSLLSKCFELLNDQRHRWDALHLFNFSSRNPQTFLIADVAESDFGMTCHFGQRTLTPYFRIGENDAKIARSRLKTTERRERALRHDHQVEIVIDGPFSEDFWSRFVALHLAKWPESVFRDARNAVLFRQVIAGLEPLGKTDFSWLKIDGEFAAMHFGFKTATKIGYYIPVADQKYQAQGIGGILLHHLIAHHSRDKREFDFLRGNEAYKFHWTDSVAANHHLLIEHGSARSRAVSQFLRAKDQLRSFGGLRKLVRAAKGR